MPIGYTRQLTRSDCNAVNALRLAGYSTASEFELLAPEHVLWDAQDDESLVLGVWEGDTLISTLRGVVARERTEAEALFDCTIDIADSLYPTLVLGRGATAESHRRIGLNALLRLYFLRAALNPANPKDKLIGASLVSPVEGAPRVRLMEQLGYRFHTPAKVDESAMRGHSKWLVGVLERSGFYQSIKLLSELTHDVSGRFPWQGAAPALHYSPLRRPNERA